MQVRHLILAFTVAAIPTSAVAQSGGSMAAVQPLHDMVKGWMTQSAEQMPEEHFSYKPTPEVRSFGELMGHVANATYMFCANATGEENPNSTDYEKATSKADIVAGVAGAFDYCDSAYQMSDAKALEEVTFFGQTGTRLWVLMFNVSHNWEHYGNAVTYMRLQGMVPPSSQGGM
jgi:uncharacterized damage-inducible protein DinB